MPRLNEISEQSLRIRQVILDMCNEPKIADEIRVKLRCTKNELAFNLRELLASKHIKIEGTKRNHNDRKCFAYLATNSEFKPVVKVKPVIQLHIPHVIEVKEVEYKPLVKQVNDYTRRVYGIDHVKTKGAQHKTSPWQGYSSFTA